jgi:HlyD family secretion protein
MMAGTTTAAHASIRRHLSAGVAVVGFLAFGVGGWASTTEISATGSMVVDSNVKKVQHPTGGIVGEIRARDGDRVQEGDILVRLDETVTRANMAIVRKGLNEFMARKARLEAERDEITWIWQSCEAPAGLNWPQLERRVTARAAGMLLPRLGPQLVQNI